MTMTITMTMTTMMMTASSSQQYGSLGMAQQTFADFLARGLPFGDVVDGRFAYHALRDPEFPDVQSWQELESYVRRRDPDTPADTLKALQSLWRLYVKES
jgi:hypothetical protein